MVQGNSGPGSPTPADGTRVIWAMTCDYVMLDTSNRFSLIGVFEGLSLPELPSMHPQFFVASLWSGPPSSSYTTETWLWSPDNEVLARTPAFPSQFSAAGKGLIVNRFLSTTFSQAGTYMIELLMDGKALHQFPLIIQTQKPAQG